MHACTHVRHLIVCMVPRRGKIKRHSRDARRAHRYRGLGVIAAGCSREASSAPASPMELTVSPRISIAPASRVPVVCPMRAGRLRAPRRPRGRPAVDGARARHSTSTIASAVPRRPTGAALELNSPSRSTPSGQRSWHSRREPLRTTGVASARPQARRAPCRRRCGLGVAPGHPARIGKIHRPGRAGAATEAVRQPEPDGNRRRARTSAVLGNGPPGRASARCRRTPRRSRGRDGSAAISALDLERGSSLATRAAERRAC
jgi:hypothetical protein